VTIISTADETRKAAVRPGEAALLTALAVMAAIGWYHSGTLSLSFPAALTTVALLFTVAVLALPEGGTGWRYWARELLPVPLVPLMFLSLGRLIPLVNPHTLDGQLEALDRIILGSEIQSALYTINLPSCLADILTIAYASFFFLPLILLVVLAHKRDAALPRVVAAVLFTFLLSYAGYFVVPAYGPRTTVAQERYATLPAGVVGAPLRNLLDHWEKTKTDAFPSGHTMVTLAVLFCSRRRDLRLYNALLPAGALLIAATVLLTYHYVVDVLAAIPLTAFAILLAARVAGPVPRAVA
jgi:hypothetical protein